MLTHEEREEMLQKSHELRHLPRDVKNRKGLELIEQMLERERQHKEEQSDAGPCGL